MSKVNFFSAEGEAWPMPPPPNTPVDTTLNVKISRDWQDAGDLMRGPKPFEEGLCPSLSPSYLFWPMKELTHSLTELS